jgi:hypothetical protein
VAASRDAAVALLTVAPGLETERIDAVLAGFFTDPPKQGAAGGLDIRHLGRHPLPRTIAAAVPRLAAAVARAAEKGDQNTTLLRLQMLRSFGRHALSQSERLRPLLSSRSSAIRYWAARVFLAAGDAGPGVELAAADLLRSEMGYECLRFLRAAGPAARRVVPLLRKRLSHADADERLHAAQALWAVGGPFTVGPRTIEPRLEALDLLTRLVEGPVSDQRLRAAGMLRDIGPAAASAAPALLRSMRNFPDESWLLVPALGGIGPAASAAVPALRALTRGERVRLRLLAAEALLKIRPGDGIALDTLRDIVQRVPDFLPEVLPVLKAAGRSARAASAWLRPLLRHPDYHLDAAAVLWEIDPEAAREAGAW